MKSGFRNRALFAVPIVVTAVAVLAVSARKPEITLRMSQAELQDRIKAKFPVEQSAFPLTVVYSDPEVSLDPVGNRIKIGLSASATLLSGRIAKGRLEGDTTVRYEPDRAALFFDDASFSRLEIEGVPEDVLKPLLPIAGRLVHDRLDSVAVYRLNADDLRHNVARAVLKDVDIEDGSVKFVLGVP
ncbi:MAG: DUF1439 domain-containing protein [Armatimonadetes bacterium]|nr:DUF1439 domain-containing protein [Armatimonadota bacterium]